MFRRFGAVSLLFCMSLFLAACGPTESFEEYDEFAEDEFVDEEFADDEFSDEEFADDEFADEEFSDEEFADEEFSDEEFADDEFADEDFSDEEFADEDFADEEFDDEDFTDDDFGDEEFADEEFAAPTGDEPFLSNPCKLADRDYDPTIGLGFPRAPTAPSSLGTVSIKVIFVDFPDAPAISTTEEILATVAPAADLYNAMSYGRITLEFDPVHTWYRMSNPGNSYSFSEYDTQLAYILEALALADPDTDFSTADIVYILASDAINLDSSAAFSTADGEFIIDGVELFAVNTSSEDYTDESVYKIFAHELGHSFGLVDLYEYENIDSPHRFAGEFDLMGNLWGSSPEMTAYHRWMLNWLDDEQIYCQEEAENTIQLTPVETAGGLKAVIVPLSESSAIVVESRRALGYDENLYEEGALVYQIDSTLDSGTGGIVVHPDAGEENWDSPLSVGESVTVEGVTIEVLEANDEGDWVSVTVSGR